MKRKWIPPFFMLFAGAVVSIVMFRMHYRLKSMLLILFAVLIVFYAAGGLLKFMLDTFDRQNREKAEAEKKETEGDGSPEEVEEKPEEGQVSREA